MRILVGALVLASAVAYAGGRYNDPVAPRPVAPRPPIVARIERLLVDEAAAEKRPVPVVDARLEAALEILGGRAHPAQVPTPRETAAALSLAGLVEPLPALLVVEMGEGAEDEAVAQVRAEAPRMLVASTYRRVAAWATRVASDGLAPRWQILVALQEANLALDPVARELPAGGSATVSGAARAPFAHPSVLVTTPSGKVVRAGDGRGARGTKFSAVLHCSNIGAHQVEIVADGPFGDAVLANFPVYCGVPAPRALPVDDTAPAEAKGVRTVADAEERVLALVDADRARAGLPPLVHDPALAAVARKHSDDMRAHGFVGHTSPTTGQPGDRVRAAGLPPTRALLENVAAAETPEEVERGFLDSPGHRANLMSRDVDRVGVGAAITDASDGRQIYVTQLFARFAAPVDAIAAVSSLRARFDQARRAHGLAPLPVDGDLDRIATSVAGEVAAGARKLAAAGDAVGRAADSLGGRYAALHTIAAVAADAADLGVTKALLSSSATAAGIGTARGVRDGQPALYVVVVVGERR